MIYYGCLENRPPPTKWQFSEGTYGKSLGTRMKIWDDFNLLTSKTTAPGGSQATGDVADPQQLQQILKVHHHSSRPRDE